ncbi:MAG TPA: DUF1223 domain-containing protein [Rhizomicrobium sp.]|nr:DUF1223 domain-containing protein [Rhizomicrobium sp.]
MKLAAVTLSSLVLAGGPVFAAPIAANPLTVVELFQSQGCSSCPPANANVMALSERSDLLTLSFGVTYWDQLGWKDTFASPQYTARQWDYARGLHHSQVYTPQVVVNGKADITGRDRSELESLIRREAHPNASQLEIQDGQVRLGTGPSGRYDVWLVRFDPKIENVLIARGENGGLTLPHKNVVKQLVKLGVWNGKPAQFPLPAAPQKDLRDAVLVQQGPGGAIVAAVRS